LTTASTAYSPIPETTPTIYSQSAYVANWLGQIAKANNEVLSKLQISKQHNLPIAIPDDISLARLAELGARDAEVAWPIFEALWSEVTAEGRPPVLMTLDSIAHIMRDSEYRSPEFELIHAQDLAIIKHFIDHFSGAKTLPNGGVLIGATTKGNTPASYAMSLAIQQKLELQNGGKNVPAIDPFKKIDMRAYQSMQHTKLIMLEGLTKPEARGLMEYWAASGVLRQTVDERTVSERWAVAGNGVVGEIERSALRMRI
jgi:small subunit ribosomal protein S29